MTGDWAPSPSPQCRRTTTGVSVLRSRTDVEYHFYEGGRERSLLLEHEMGSTFCNHDTSRQRFELTCHMEEERWPSQLDRRGVEAVQSSQKHA